MEAESSNPDSGGNSLRSVLSLGVVHSAYSLPGKMENYGPVGSRSCKFDSWLELFIVSSLLFSTCL